MVERRALSYAPLNHLEGGCDMTKAQLVSKLAEETDIPKKQVDQLIEQLVGTVIKTVKKGENLKIPGLGVFRLRKMKARMGRNPQTGEPIKIPARKKVGFTVAKSFKETVLGTSKR
jgi:DNA-binding protein HU-beta